MGQSHENNKTLRLGFVGIGGRDTYHLNCALGIEGLEVPAICEINYNLDVIISVGYREFYKRHSVL